MSADNRPPPHDLIQEAEIVAACALDETNKYFHRVAHLIDPEDFYSPAHRRVWEAITHVAGEGAIDVTKIIHRLKQTERLAEVGGLGFLRKLVDETRGIVDLEAHAMNIRAMSRMRGTIATCQRLAADGYAARTDYRTWLSNASVEVAKAAQLPPKSTLSPLSVGIEKVFQQQREIDKARASGSDAGGLSSGLVDLDEIAGKEQGGNLIIVAARPGMGKTSLALGMGLHTGRRHDPTTLYATAVFSLEMTETELAMRLLSAESGIPVQDIIRGDCDVSALDAAARRIVSARMVLDDQSRRLEDIEAAARRFAFEMALCRGPEGQTIKLGKIVVDYLQLVEVERRKDRNREQEVSEVTRRFKALGKELGCVVMLLAQLNRGVEARPDKRPKMSDLRESGSIEQDADRIYFLYRDDYYNPDSVDKNVAELIISKNRSGGANRTVYLRWHGETTSFFDLERDFVPSRPATPAPTPRRRGRRSSNDSSESGPHWNDS